MKDQLIMGIIATIMAILMVVCLVVDVMTANWLAFSICVIALFLNTTNAIRCFRTYQTQKAMEKLIIINIIEPS